MTLGAVVLTLDVGQVPAATQGDDDLSLADAAEQRIGFYGFDLSIQTEATWTT